MVKFRQLSNCTRLVLLFDWTNLNKAVVITQPGGAELLSLQEVAEPQPGAGEVVIDLYASALNRADLLQRQGAYPPPAGAPPYPGLEAAGRVFLLGKGV